MWVSPIARRGVAMAGRSGVAASARASVTAAAHIPRSANGEAAAFTPSQRRKLSTNPVPSAASAAADPTGAVAGSTAEDKTKGSSSGSESSPGEELWIVGRVMEDMDTRLAAKQEKLRVHEIGVIDRYAAVVTGLDGSLDPREGDDFLAWLGSRGLLTETDAAAVAGGGASSSGNDDDNAEHIAAAAAAAAAAADGAGGAEKRAGVEEFLTAAAARLNALVADREESLFGDRGEDAADEGGGDGNGGGAAEKGAAAAAVSPNMSDEDLYQARLGAHRAMLCHCLSILSTSLSKQQLKTGLSVEEVAVAARSAYLAAPEDRLRAIFPLFDTHGDGHLDADGVERAVDAVVLPVAVAIERCYLAAARPALDKKAAAAMPATMKYALWDVLEVPVKRRCAFAWAEDRTQVGPAEWRISWDQFAPSRRTHFPEFESVANDYVKEFSRRRSAWHASRKGRKEAMVYGSALLVLVVFLDNVLKMV